MVKNQLKTGAFLSYLQMAVNIIVGLLYTPLMIRLLGKSEYGLYNTVASVISMLSVLSLGFNSGYIRFYSKYKKQEDNLSIYKLNGLFLIIFTIIGIVAFLCGLFLSQNLNIVFEESLTTKELEIAKVLMLILSVNLATTFIMSVFSNIISAHEKFVFLKILGIVKHVMGPLVTIPVLLMGYRSIAVVTVTVILNLIVDICYFLYVVFVLKMKFIFKGFEKGIFKSLLTYTSFIAINLIVDQVNWNLAKFMLGGKDGTDAVAVYSAGYTLFQYYMMFSTAISGVFSPRIHRIATTSENIDTRKVSFTELFTKVGRIQFLILALISSGFCFFGQEFMNLWAGKGYELSYYVAVLLMITGTFTLIQTVGIEIQRALNKHQFRSLTYVCMAVFNIILTNILIPRLGVIGAVIGTAASFILANGIAMNIYYHLKCDVNVLTFWKNILRMSLGLIAPVIMGFLIRGWLDLTNLWNFAFGIVIYSAVYCISMWIIGMNSYERLLVKKPLEKILGKIKKKHLN